MRHQTALTLSTAALSLALLLPASARAGSPQSSRNTSGAQAGQQEAMRMVPARATLLTGLNSKKTEPGYQFKARLEKMVHLDNGPELPSGTVLTGRVATDDMQVAGSSKLALRFTQATLKTGQVVPIKATIVGLYKREGDNEWDDANYTIPNSWNDGTLQVDQIGVTSGVDLHSRIASKNSGVFVSTTKDDMKLPEGSEIELAIAARNHGHQNGNGMSAGNR